MKRLLFYIVAIIVMAIFTALLQSFEQQQNAGDDTPSSRIKADHTSVSLK